MQLSKFTDLGLRTLMRIGTAPEGTRVTMAWVAAQMWASPAHLAKVVTRLNALGVVRAQRGRGGGLTITDEGWTRTVGSLVRDLEGVGDIVDCTRCPLDGSCRLRHLLAEAEDAFLSVLDRATLSDLIADPTSGVLLTLGMRPTPDPAGASHL